MPEHLRVVHITDTHLLSEPGALLKGVDTDATLRRVLAHIATYERPFHLLLATGDLAHDEREATYERLKRYWLELGAPVRWTPGNHDDPALMHRALTHADAVRGPQTLRLGAWQIVPMQSAQPDSDAGRLGEAELERLNTALREQPHAHALIALHHPPVSVGTPAMDAIGLTDAEALFRITDRHAQVRAVVWGHFHHAYDTQRAGVRLLGTPSTCYQMRLGGEQVEMDDLPPGYRRLELTAKGEVVTEVVRVPPP